MQPNAPNADKDTDKDTGMAMGMDTDKAKDNDLERERKREKEKALGRVKERGVGETIGEPSSLQPQSTGVVTCPRCGKDAYSITELDEYLRVDCPGCGMFEPTDSEMTSLMGFITCREL